MRVAVVGCNVNGAYIASKLTGHNEVVVFEKNDSGGGKACSGLVSERIWNFLTQNEKIVQNRIKTVKIHFKEKTVSVRFKPDMLAIRRCDIDSWAAKIAEEAGAEIRYNSFVEKVVFVENRKPQLLVNGKYLEFDRIIGCDGGLSTIRKSMGCRDPNFRLGIQCFRQSEGAEDFVDVYPTENGFFWKIPRGSSVEYGIMERQILARKIYDNFAKRFRISNLPVEAALIPEGIVLPKSESITLCGDAAGLTKNWSGGGIIWGLTAANFLIETFPDFLGYRSKVLRFFSPRILFAKMLTKTAVGVGNAAPFLIPQNIGFDVDFGI